MKKRELKRDIIKDCMELVVGIDCRVDRVYGVSHGVGYDLTVKLIVDGYKAQYIHAHALKDSWCVPSHLRPNNPPYKYTGSNDVYQNDVIEYWERMKTSNDGKQYSNGFVGYLEYLKKDDLLELRELLQNTKESVL